MKWITGGIYFDSAYHLIGGWVNLDNMAVSRLRPDKALREDNFIGMITSHGCSGEWVIIDVHGCQQPLI
jgi:hypothetical protein